MDWLLVPIWAALVYALFTLLRIRVDPWTVGVAVLAGAVGIGSLSIAMRQAAPYSGRLQVVVPTTAIVPAVGGRVVEVSAQPGASVKAGDQLFRLDPTAYELVVAQRRAALAATEPQVKTLMAAAEAAPTEAGRAALRAQADVSAATVARIRAELAVAELELAQTVVRAPRAGSIAAVTVRTGNTVTAGGAAAALTIVDDTPADRTLEARFRSSAAQLIHVGDEAELAFDGVPGRVFKAKVKAIAPATAPGSPHARRGGAGLAVVSFDTADDGAAAAVVAGATGVAAIYTDRASSVAVVRRILLRMRSWLSYVCR